MEKESSSTPFFPAAYAMGRIVHGDLVLYEEKRDAPEFYEIQSVIDAGQFRVISPQGQILFDRHTCVRCTTTSGETDRRADGQREGGAGELFLQGGRQAAQPEVGEEETAAVFGADAGKQKGKALTMTVMHIILNTHLICQ